ncbi:Nitric oxide synthase, inducible, partial [Ophiophagus hannah]
MFVLLGFVWHRARAAIKLNLNKCIVLGLFSAQKVLQNNTIQTSRCPRHLKIKNWETGTILQDALHHEAKEVLNCQNKVCQGSLMNPKGLIRGPREEPIPRDKLLHQAAEFIHLFYNTLQKAETEEHTTRLEAVAQEIERTGTYQLTKEELIFATKQAWRNAPRCIGRIQWSNLQVFDARSCTNAKEMFEHLCRHVEYATNGGNIRSRILCLLPFFPFSQLCIQLGWRAKYGCFDVLPLVLQADGQDPELFELPPELVLEVSMEHPTYEWFKDLDLKWYALPAVSNMLLEVGGLEFTACPFNGWYMGTEIGVRDFCDARRYNILQEVGRRMGLETNKLSSLWKDKAVIEVNIAVLHSFQKQSITIMDHHSAAESFMKYMQNEYRIRGGCPADWVWLVPPISGSITPLFHQEMLNYIISPFYYYQVTCMGDYNLRDLDKETLLLVVTSTFGNGDAPSNGKTLQNALLSMKQLSNKFRYAVFGLGSSMYPEFCAFACLVHQKLAQLGAFPVSPMGEGDELNGQEEAFRNWAILTFQEINYLPGDHLGIFPANRKALVDGIISHVADAPPFNEIFRLETCRDCGYWAPYKKFPACTLSQALMHFLDVTSPPSQQLLRSFSQLAEDKSEKERLNLLCHNLEEYNKWKFYNSPTILEVLEEFPSIRLSTSFLLSQLPLLKPRYYSISSSQDWEPQELHLTVAVVTYRSRNGKGPVHHGVCSTWLNTVALKKTIPCFIRSAAGFQLPKDPRKPCILIGPGTGIAPFRSFWQQRHFDLEKKGIQGRGLILLFGCRHSSLDHLYREEMEEMHRKGILQEVYTAYSRHPGSPKVYVQDLLRNKLEAEVYRLLHEEEGHLYVCGDIHMASEVAKTLKEMFAKKLSLTEEEAEDYCFQLKVR